MERLNDRGAPLSDVRPPAGNTDSVQIAPESSRSDESINTASHCGQCHSQVEKTFEGRSRGQNSLQAGVPNVENVDVSPMFPGEPADPVLYIVVEPEVAPVGGTATASAYGKKTVSGEPFPVKANWTVDHPGYFIGANQNVFYASFSSDASGLLGVYAEKTEPPNYEGASDAFFVGVERMQYMFDDSWIDMADAINVCVGTTLDFRVLPSPADTPWPAGKPVWGGESSGTGEETSKTFTEPGTNYVTAECGNVVTGTVVVVEVELTPESTNVCWRSDNEVSIVLTNSYTPEGVTWSGTNGLNVVSADDAALVFLPTNSTPTNYIIRAEAVGFTNCFDTSTVNVLKPELVVSTNLLTLMHNRECELEIVIHPVSFYVYVQEYTIEIKRAAEDTWYTLSTNQTMTPWYANIAGNFHLRGSVVLNDFTCTSTNGSIEVQFPSYSEIVSDTNVIAWTETEWQNTLDDCTEDPNQRRERGFWIRLNTIDNLYEHTGVVTGSWVDLDEGATINLGSRPVDSPEEPAPNLTGAVYSVASFHTHTPYTYLPTNDWRYVGPSTEDHEADESDDVTGVVYDYVGDQEGKIWGGDPKDAPAQRYQSGDMRRSTP